MISCEPGKTINIIHIEAEPAKIWRAVATPDGSNCYLSDHAETTGDRDEPRQGDRFFFIYGDIENESVCLAADFPHSFQLADSYKSMLPDGTIVPYELQTTFTITPLEQQIVQLTVEVTGYGSTSYDMWIRECMETGWRRSLLNLKSVLELGLDLRNEIFGYPRIGVTNTGHSALHAAETGYVAGVGNYMLDTFPGGPAHNAGLRKGDVVTHISGIPTNSYGEFVRALSGHYQKSDCVHVMYIREGKTHTTEIELTYDDRFTGLIEQATTSEQLQQVRMNRQKTRLAEATAQN